METELAMRAQEPLAKVRTVLPDAFMRLIEIAIEKGSPPKELFELCERAADRNARQEFIEAKSAFQAECPLIPKTNVADIESRRGGRFTYKYEKLADIVVTIRPLLDKHGFTVTWDGGVQGTQYTSTCKLSHVGGHAESATFTVPTTSSAGMSEQQKVSSAAAFADRHSLRRVLGLVTVDEDNDSPAAGDFETIAGKESIDLLDALYEMTDGSDDACVKIREAFCRRYGIATVNELPKSKLADAWASIEKKREQQKAKP